MWFGGGIDVIMMDVGHIYVSREGMAAEEGAEAVDRGRTVKVVAEGSESLAWHASGWWWLL